MNDDDVVIEDYFSSNDQSYTDKGSSLATHLPKNPEELCHRIIQEKLIQGENDRKRYDDEIAAIMDDLLEYNGNTPK